MTHPATTERAMLESGLPRQRLYQNLPDQLLPAALRENNSQGVPRGIDGKGQTP